MIDNLY